MKKCLVVIVAIMLSACVAGGGGTALIKNEVDSFTGTSVKRTSFEEASDRYSLSASMYNFIRFSKIDNVYYLDFKTILAGGNVFAIDANDELMLKLSSGEILKLKALKFRTTCKGCGAEGLSGSGRQGMLQNYRISEEQVNQIINDLITDLRLYTTDGYIDEAVPPKDATNISKIAELILQ